MNLCAVAMLAAMCVTAPGSADDLLRDADGVVGGGLAPLTHTRTDWNPDRIEHTLRSPAGARVLLRLRRTDPRRTPTERLSRYDLDVEVTTPSDALSDELKQAVDRAVARLRTREAQGPELRAERADAPTTAAPGATGGPGGARAPPNSHRAVPAADDARDVELALCLLLLLLSLALMPALGRATRGLLCPDRLHYAALALVALVQLFVVPDLLVSVYSGYGTVAEAAVWRPVVKYGAATTAVYAPILNLLGPSTDVLLIVNRLLGVLTVPLAAALAVRLAGTRAAGLFGIAVAGLLVALLRDRASESILVPMAFWATASLVLLAAWLDHGRRSDLVAVVAFGGLALHARPEPWAVLPLLVVAVALTAPNWRRLAVAALATAAAGAPRLWSLWHYSRSAATHGDVPGLAEGGLRLTEGPFTDLNALWWPDIFPVTASLLALLALAAGPSRRRLGVGLWILAILVWQALSTLDLPPVSVPRTQAPALLWTATLAAAALGWLWDRSRPLSVALLLLVVVPLPANVDYLYQPTNAHAFDHWWRGAVPRVPEAAETRCLIALAQSDEPRDVLMRLYPVYELAERSERLEMLTLTTFLEAPGIVLQSGCEPLYLEGPHCWASFFGYDSEPPLAATQHPLCARMHAEFRLEAIAAQDVPNAGNADFPVFGASETLRYGLYRVSAP